ncbi:MAG: GtrA family protein [Devosia sp.]
MNVALESLVPDPFAAPARRDPVFGQLIAFLLVGGSGAVAFVLLSTIAIGLRPPVPDWVASTVCYAALIGPVYLLHRRFSFRSSAPHGHALPRYVGVQIGAICLASLFSYVTYHLLGLPTVWASLLVTGLTSGVSFVILKAWAFTHPAAAVPAAVPNAVEDIFA